MGKTVLVAGGAGFLGSHLVDRLLAQGHSVIAVDNLVTGNKSNLRSALKSPRFEFMRKDITKPFKISRKLHAIYHLASPASPKDFASIPLQILDANVAGSRNLLELARAHKARYLFASTSEVYGNPLVHPQTESYFGNVNTVGDRSCYDESKRLGETLVFLYRKHFGVDAKIVRIFNTFGPRMRPEDGRVIPNFISQALAGKPLTLYGKGLQTRSFCFVSDLVRGLQLLMDSDESGPVNIGNPQERTMREAAQTILALTGSSSKIIFRPLPTSDDPLRRKPDISLAKKKLGWKPEVSFEEGLKETIVFFEKSA